MDLTSDLLQGITIVIPYPSV